MMGAGYTGGIRIPDIRIKEKFAWLPILTTSGKWVWWRKYIKLKRLYWGPAGEGPATDAVLYTEGEWLLEEIKNSHKNPLSPPSGSGRARYY
jgi:hypothetical protein